jgi:hypothetical protein
LEPAHPCALRAHVGRGARAPSGSRNVKGPSERERDLHILDRTALSCSPSSEAATPIPRLRRGYGAQERSGTRSGGREPTGIF